MTELVSPGTSASTPPKSLLPRKSMTAGEGGVALLFAIAAVASLIGATKAEGTALACHAHLAAPASVAAVFALLTHYFDRRAALPLQEIGNKPNYHLGPMKLAAGPAVLCGIARFLVGLWAARELAWPALNFDLAWVNFGRFRPAVLACSCGR
jgi:cytochrome c oxidase cbb3-type subunit I